MRRDHSNNGGPAPTLWWVEVVPLRKKLGDADMKRAVELAKGTPSDPQKALGWLTTSRFACFARVRQRLVVFRGKKKAAGQAKEEASEFWSAHVRAVRVM